MFTEPSHSNIRGADRMQNSFLSIVACVFRVSVAQQFLHGVNTPKYLWVPVHVFLKMIKKTDVSVRDLVDFLRAMNRL
jgi:hypothetical protein